MSDDDNEDKLDKTSILTSDTFKVRLAQAGQAPPCLVLLVGPPNQIGRQWPIEDTDRVIGRDVGAYISVSDRSVSKSHAKLIMSSGEVEIIDLESTNKTIVNGKSLSPLQPHRLQNNDQIKMGNIIFKFLERGNIETVSVAQTFDRGHTDALTGLYNKGALMAQGPELYNKAQMLGIPFGVLTFDIDFFKKVNDTYGHSAGDYVLKELSRVVKSGLIREGDFFARSGGEEFTLILLGNALEKVREVAERIRLTIEKHDFSFEGTKMPISISVGVSVKQDGDSGWQDTFERADKALYTAKEGGRNQVQVFKA